jgi:hypothetical protein
MDFPLLTPPDAADPDAIFERIWEMRDDLVRRVWGTFQEVYVHREMAEEGPYVYVSEIPPEAQARSADRWTYVTGGLSLPWDVPLDEINPDDYSTASDALDAAGLAAVEIGGVGPSGYGFEIVLHTPQRAPWAVHVLHNLGKYVMQHHEGFAPGHRVPLGGPIIHGSNSDIRVLLFAPPGDRAPRFRLPSGLGTWLVAIGITEDEWDYAHREGSAALLGLLRHAGLDDLTDPARLSVFIHDEADPAAPATPPVPGDGTTG